MAKKKVVEEPTEEKTPLEDEELLPAARKALTAHDTIVRMHRFGATSIRVRPRTQAEIIAINKEIEKRRKKKKTKKRRGKGKGKKKKGKGKGGK